MSTRIPGRHSDGRRHEHAPADLKGRKVAINVRRPAEYKLAKALATGRVTANDVDVQIISTPDMVAVQSTADIDAGLLLQPAGAQTVAKGVGKILFDHFDWNGQGAIAVANSGCLNKHPDTRHQVLEVHLQATWRLSDRKITTDHPGSGAEVNQRPARSDPARPGHPAGPHVFYLRTGSTEYSRWLDIDS